MPDFICNLEVWSGLTNRIRLDEEADLSSALSLISDYRKTALLYAAKHKSSDPVLYSVIQYEPVSDRVLTVSLFEGTAISEDDLRQLTETMPDAEFGVLYPENTRLLAKKLHEEEESKRIVPLTVREANAFVSANHRHHDSVTGCKFSIGLVKTVDGEDKLIGAAICGRPVSRHLDDGKTLEINRLCTTEKGNCCSMLYGRCCKIAKDMGYQKIITYILESEPGTSLKASGFELEDECCGGANWTGKRKRSGKKDPDEYKQRWGKRLIA